MRQLHVIPYYRPATEFGGVQTVTQQLAEAMARRGHAVTVLTTDAASRGDRLLAASERLDGVEVVRLRNLSQRLVRANLYTPRGARRALRTLVAQHDVVHAHDVFNWLTYRAIAEAARARVPSVLSTDNLLNFQGLPSRVRARRLLWRLLGPPTIERVALVHAIRPGELDCAAMGIPEGKVRYVPNGVAYPPPAGDGARFRVRHGVGDRAVVLFVGQLMQTKGARFLVELAHRWRERDDVVFVFVGYHHPEVDLTVDGAVPANARFTGFLSGADLEDAYAAGDLYALPTSTDVLPNTLLEALARGLPTILSRHAGLPELEDAGAGVFVELTTDDLERGVRALLERRAAWPAMAAAARRLVEGSFALDRVHDGYARLYAEVVGGG